MKSSYTTITYKLDGVTQICIRCHRYLIDLFFSDMQASSRVPFSILYAVVDMITISSIKRKSAAADEAVIWTLPFAFGQMRMDGTR
jgi:hypothetical protein